MAEEESGWGRVVQVQVDEEISFTRGGTRTMDTVALDVEEYMKENDTESDDTDEEEEVSFTRISATTAARSSADIASSTRTHIEATVTRRGGFTELGMKSLLFQLLKDKEELGKDKEELLKSNKKLAKEKDQLVKKIQNWREVEMKKMVQSNARVSASEDPVENVTFDDQQMDEESTMGYFRASDKDGGEAGDNNNIVSQGSRDIGLLEEQNGEEEVVVDDEEFQEEIQLDEDVGLVDSGTAIREPEDGEGMEQTPKESETQEALNGVQVQRNKRQAITIGGKEKRYPCDQSDCTKTCSSAGNLKKHIQSVHKKARPFMCKVPGCSKKFGFKSGLNHHTFSIHLEERPFKCKVTGCSKDFGSKGHLEFHQRAAGHGKEKLVCTFAKCTAAFSSSGNLSTHVRNVHLEERRFNCLKQDCGKKFKQKIDVEEHLRSAHGAPKLVCKHSNCNAKFAFSSALYKHMKKSH